MSNSEKQVSGASILLAFLGGAAIGASAGLLLAPRAGKETRKRMGEAAQRSRSRVEQVPKAIGEASHAAKAAFKNSLETNASS
ncbi:MAG: YtxH domain-containing protein [Myxococcales bacterium]|nr:MAG: YtxH domain-containing protein [Myxococcales bacterium]